jgi:hypothetical protein
VAVKTVKDRIAVQIVKTVKNRVAVKTVEDRVAVKLLNLPKIE